MFNQSRLNDAGLISIIDVANRIWMPYGITIQPVTSAGAGAVAVVIVPQILWPAPTDSGPTVLGTTLFTRGHATPFIHLSVDGAEAFADGSGIGGRVFKLRPREDRDAILLQMMGGALAHELGHYLLDTTKHSSGGLLRASLSPQDLEHPEPARLWLTKEQQDVLCRAANLTPGQ